MWGRALFALVLLVMAAGLLLPLYPPNVTGLRWAAVDGLSPATASRAVACEDWPVAEPGSEDCQPECWCGGLAPAVFVTVADRFGRSVILLIQPPAGPPPERLLLPRLPAV
jgi:hypothetical protein